MADLFDPFNGAAAPLHGRVSPQGGTWSDPDGQLSTNGTGGLICTGTPSVTNTPASSNSPGVDCAGSFVVGADVPLHTEALLAICLRKSGTPTAPSYYMCRYEFTAGTWVLNVLRIIGGAVEGITGNLGATITPGANDLITYTINGTGSSVAINAYQNGILRYTINDTDPTRLTSGDGVGILFGPAGYTDMLRAIWAGPWVSGVTGPPAITIVPATPTVSVSGTQPFTATTAFTGESFNWSASAGTISGTLATETWTAPGAGTSATVTGSSIDLPGRTATATPSLTSSGATAFTLTGPSSGYNHNESTDFTFTPVGGSFTGSITPVMSGGLAGTWSVTPIIWTASSAAKTSRFTPSAIGSGTANGTSTLTAPAGIAYMSLAQTLSVTPGALPTSSTTTETFFGGGTHWNTMTPTFTPSGLAGVTVGAVSVMSDTLAYAMITTPATPGSVILTDSTTGATAIDTVSQIVIVLSIGEGFATGLTNVGYAVYDTAGALISAWTSGGVTERGTNSGDYGASIPIARDGHDYEIRWSQTSGTTPPYVHDIRSSDVQSGGGTVYYAF